jgi:ABC-type microcin C transport system permease subunit YejB
VKTLSAGLWFVLLGVLLAIFWGCAGSARRGGSRIPLWVSAGSIVGYIRLSCRVNGEPV